MVLPVLIVNLTENKPFQIVHVQLELSTLMMVLLNVYHVLNTVLNVSVPLPTVLFVTHLSKTPHQPVHVKITNSKS